MRAVASVLACVCLLARAGHFARLKDVLRCLLVVVTLPTRLAAQLYMY